MATTYAAAAQPAMLLRQADSAFLAGNYAWAQPRYQTFLTGDTGRAITWNRFGYCLQQAARYDDALQCYTKALAKNPSPPPLKASIESRMARCYAAMYDTVKSLQWLQVATGSGYSNLRELDTLPELAALRRTSGFQQLYQRLYQSAYPCSRNPMARQFDFWIGEWDVYQNGTMALAGHSLVQNIAGGCSLLENWTSVVGAHHGKSLNYYDTLKQNWEQVWVGSGGDIQHFTDGVYKDSVMQFAFRQVRNGKTMQGRFRFYYLSANQVRQLSELSGDGGVNWQVQYDFIYKRKQPKPGT
jgi:tetratricopeptide (TPR) repeat protein